jgi:hypothetical protein
MKRMSIALTEHPADKMALALSRASGIVASVAHCFSDKSNDFAVTAAFIVHALKTVDTFIAEASGSLDDLNRDYDLTVPKMDLPPIPQRPDGEDEDSSSFSANSNDVRGKDQIATTYDELLAKVTAAEVFAMDQDHTSSGESDLVSVLNSLKADLLRLRSVA